MNIIKLRKCKLYLINCIYSRPKIAKEEEAAREAQLREQQEMEAKAAAAAAAAAALEAKSNTGGEIRYVFDQVRNEWVHQATTTSETTTSNKVSIQERIDKLNLTELNLSHLKQAVSMFNLAPPPPPPPPPHPHHHLSSHLQTDTPLSPPLDSQ